MIKSFNCHTLAKVLRQCAVASQQVSPAILTVCFNSRTAIGNAAAVCCVFADAAVVR
jgi:hypothetical protein